MSVPFSPDQFVRGRPTKRLRVAELQPTQVYVDGAKMASTDGDVYDGHHRLGATILRKRKTIDAVVYA